MKTTCISAFLVFLVLTVGAPGQTRTKQYRDDASAARGGGDNVNYTAYPRVDNATSLVGITNGQKGVVYTKYTATVGTNLMMADDPQGMVISGGVAQTVLFNMDPTTYGGLTIRDFTLRLVMAGRTVPSIQLQWGKSDITPRTFYPHNATDYNKTGGSFQADTTIATPRANQTNIVNHIRYTDFSQDFIAQLTPGATRDEGRNFYMVFTNKPLAGTWKLVLTGYPYLGSPGGHYPNYLQQVVVNFTCNELGGATEPGGRSWDLRPRIVRAGDFSKVNENGVLVTNRPRYETER